MEINESVEVKPLHVNNCRPLDLHIQEPAEKLIQELIEGGVLKPQTKSTDWCSQVRFVMKGDKIYLCTDFRQLNKVLKHPVKMFILPDKIQKKLHSSSKYFAKLDMPKSYIQVNIAPKDQDATTFLLPQGRYAYTKLPMGSVQVLII